MVKHLFSLKSIKGWHHSIAAKITQFLLAGIIIAFATGAFTRWNLIDSFSYQQWVHQAEANAQIATYIVRNVYTTVSVEADNSRQISRIVSEHKLGDADSIIQTGYNPVDELALASVQTHNPTRLFMYQLGEGLKGISNTIDGKERFISAVPILTPSGEFLGSIVSSIGNKSELYAAYDAVLKKSSIILALMLLGTLVLVTVFMRRLFRPVPQLINALTRIAQEETNHSTPYLDKDDEIGRLAGAIEKLRIAMVERNYLQHMQDMSRKLEHMAHHDSLTGLPNRTAFGIALEDRINEVNQGENRFNLLVIDLDNFKPVNDTFGHKAGDDVLGGVAQRLNLLLGQEDVATRQGGNESAVLQHVEHDNVQEGEALAMRIVRALSAPFSWGNHVFSISCSIGITAAPAQGTNAPP